MREDECLDPDELAAYLRGNVVAERLSEIDSHLESCERCESTVRNLEEATDFGLGALRGKPLLATSEPSQLDPDLRERLREIPDRTVSSRNETARSAETSLAGRQLKQFELLELIGRGGMGAVYKARHLRLDRLFAVKVLPTDRLKDAAAVDRFHREMRAVGRVQHPNVVNATDADEAEGIHFLAMELIDGQTFSQLVAEQGPLPVSEACDLICQAALGLEAVHQRGLVHRDIKPSNLLVTKSGVVKILDLGLALLNDDPTADQPTVAGDALTSTDQIMGTADYMAPEQALDTHRVDIRADLYSLGCTLFFLLTGRPPYHDATQRNPLKALMAHAQQAVPSIREVRPDVPAELSAIITRLLAKSPADRFDTPALVAQQLESFTDRSEALRSNRLADTSILPRINTTEPPKPRRNRRLTLVAATAFVLLAGTVLTIATDRGTLEIDVDPSISENIKVTVLRNGEALHKGWELKPGHNTLRVRTGPVVIELPTTDKDRFLIEPNSNSLTVTRGTTVAFRLTTRTQSEQANQKLSSPQESTKSPDAKTTHAPKISSVPAEPQRDESFALDFNGQDSIVVIPDISIQALSDVTVEAWVRHRPSPVKDVVGTILCLGGIPMMHVGYNEKLEFFQTQVRRDRWDGVFFKPSLVYERCHIAAVRSGQALSLFINGQKVETTSNGMSKTPGKHYEDYGATIGGLQSVEPPVNRQMFDGIIDELRISETARYVKDFSPDNRFASDKGTIALYHFDEGSGVVLSDSSGNGHHGRIQGATWVRRVDRSSHVPMQPRSEPSPRVWLFDAKSLAGWQPLRFPNTAKSPEAVWSVDAQRGVLVARADDHSALQSEKEFENFVLSLEWRFPPGASIHPNGSGIVVRSGGLTTSEPAPGYDPRGIEVDLRSPTESNDDSRFGTGCLISYEVAVENSSGKVTGIPPSRHLRRLRQPNLKPIGEWNSCEITCQNDRLKVLINGDLINEAWGVAAPRGKIAIRAQLSDIEFRSISIEELPSAPTKGIPPSPGNWKPGDKPDALLGLAERPADFAGIRSWSLQKQIPWHTVWSVDWSPNSKKLAVAATSAAHQLFIYDFNDGELRLSQVMPSLTSGLVSCARWSPDGKWLAAVTDEFQSPSRKAQLFVWDAVTFAESYRIGLPTSKCGQIDWGADGDRIAGVSDNQLWGWRLGDATTYQIAPSRTSLGRVAWSPDMSKIATNDTDNDVKIWTASGALHSELGGWVSHPRCFDIAWSPDGKWLARGGFIDRTWPRVWNTADGTSQHLEVPAVTPSVCWASDNRRLFTPSVNGPVHIWVMDPSSRQKITELPCVSNGVSLGQGNDPPLLALSKDDRWLVSATTGVLALFDTSKQTPLAQVLGTHPSIQRVVWSGNSERFATGTTDGVVRVWNRLGQQHFGKRVAQAYNESVLALNPTGELLAVETFVANDKPMNVTVFEVATGRTVSQIATGQKVHEHTRLAWSPQGDWLAMKVGVDSPPQETMVQIWNPVTRSILAFDQSLGKIKAFDWDSRGARLAISSASVGQPTLQVWDFRKNQVLAKLPNLSAEPYGIRWSPHDADLVAVMSANSLQLIDVKSQTVRWNKGVEGLRGLWFNNTEQMVAITDRGVQHWAVSDGRILEGQIVSRLQNFSGPFFASHSPNGETVLRTLADGSLVVLDGSMFEVLRRIVPLTVNESAIISPAGELLNPTPDITKRLAWIAERSEGKSEVLNFKQFQESILPGHESKSSR